MTKDIFYAILKLVSGEEIISKICPFIEKDEILIVLDNPTVVNVMEVKNGKSLFIKMFPWVSASSQTTHIINRNHIITMIEVKDKHLVQIYQKYLKEKDNDGSQTKITKGMGYVSSTTKARETLENIYKSEDYKQNLN